MGSGSRGHITARSGGELLWTAGGVFGEDDYSTDRYTATVTSYADSDCTVDAYGESGPARSTVESSFLGTMCVGGVRATRGSGWRKVVQPLPE